ncbi:hypothetical protein [Marinoscillum pacificum]|uniref:hypothetical protein n=1 Tax=Marinoscillum pacificum TaxID=392723 RepID=UPI0021588BEC|nr:hypothetical protein [Marinoscillum pacificum]
MEWVVFALTIVLNNCGVVIISGVDWDNRFYIPMESGIVVLSGYGADKVIQESINYIFNSGNEA